MAKVVVIGAGFAGHTAALYLGDKLGKKHTVTVINRHDSFAYIPSWIWVSVGQMKPERTTFKLGPVYKRKNVYFIHGKATKVYPDEGQQFVEVEKANGDSTRVEYDYLLVATGPKLAFDATPGLGPDQGGNTYSICSLPHVTETRDKYLDYVERMKKGEKVKMVIGTGHGTSTCQGAAFEFITNVHKDLIKKGVRDKAELLWLSNETALGDFGVRGVLAKYKGKLTTSEEFISAVFKDAGIKSQVQTAVKSVDAEKIYWENYEGEEGETDYDFAMLIPKFSGQPIDYIGKDGSDISSKVVNAGGFVIVDGIYDLDYDTLERNPDAWPSQYQNPTYPNIFAAGIAFAPPGPISRPHKTPNGTPITAAPPRTGMVSGIIGRVVALNIIDLIKDGRMTHSERMSEMVAACIASMGNSLWDGSAATIVVHPVVPDMRRYPNEGGRDLFTTHMEMGLSGAWLKRMLHDTFIWKLRALPGWKIIPE
ncbi:MAG: FAD-dependent oxidoreductase [Anaerolineae bacterium]|jgi:sulfide:quinone oxidoreductase|nr:FAD-dependent oxidoreductase [Anaerolineae bacterium]MBT7076002.1 FAD-dependent oxidoreductase [Anaerolineae bacterium]MBT7783723.1 FAD-dependent oxidoreductase [Anaerolineae bacterium]